MPITRRALSPTPTSVGAQPVDDDLTAIAALTPSNDDLVQRKSGAWTNRTPAQLKTDLSLTKSDVGLGNVTNNAQVTGVTAGDATITIGGTATAPTVAVAGSTFQPVDADLTTIAGLSAATAGVLATDGSGWSRFTYPQLRTALDDNLLTVGEATVHRDNLSSFALPTGTQLLRMTFFTARKSETTTQVRMLGGSTAAAATPTLVRIGLYSIDGAGAGTLVASTANDTALFASANTIYTKSWSSSYAKVAGQRYALGLLVVTAGTAPTVCGYTANAATAIESLVAPTRAAYLASQTDLPSSFVAASLAGSGTAMYAAILP